MRLLDAPLRLAYRAAYQLARVSWRIRQPFHRGALVALWVGDRVLAVRQSYAPWWTFPGGGVEAGEGALAAAARELLEETGVRLPASALRPAIEATHRWNHRVDQVHFYEARLDARPAIELDRRELVESRWVTLAELVELPIAPHVRDYASFARKRVRPFRGIERNEG